MSVTVPSGGAASPLLSILEQAGAVFSSRDGHPSVVHYGSPAGELAVCVSSVGLVDRSALSKLVIEAPRLQLGLLTSRLIGGCVAPGGALQAAGAWCCGESEERVLVLSERRVARRLQARIREHAVHYAALTVSDRSSDWAAIELLGPATGKLLADLGAYGESRDPRSVSPFGPGAVGGCAVHWLLQSDRRALVLVPTESAGLVWRAIERAGRRFGISCVGTEAASRYALLERSSDGTSLRV
jgi:glycine cleavage system aminomethyltransferase T